MLGIVGLLGALMAGIVGDALMAMAHKDDDDDDAETASDVAPESTGDLLDDGDPAPNPETDTETQTTAERPDTDPAEQAPMPTDEPGGTIVVGNDADEFILGTSAADWLSGSGGDDTIDGGADADTLFGGTGNDSLSGTADDAADHLHGGDGDDTVHIGAGDTARGDAGADAFSLSDYAPGDPPAVIADYTPGTDRIVLMYDAQQHPEPMVQTEAIEGTEDVSVLLDGIRIAIVQGAAGLDYRDIELMAA